MTNNSDVRLEVDLQVVIYVTISFIALLIYDWIISLNREVSRIWRSKWTLVKVLYLYTRYSPLVSLSISMEERLSSTCNLMTFTTIFAGFGIGMADLILILRTYSIYNKSRKILAFFGLSFIIITAVSFWAISHSTDFFSDQEKSLNTSSSCLLANERSSFGLICYIALLSGESVITLLTVWKTFDSYRQSGFHLSQVASMIYCEGLFYYFMILPLTIANVTVILAAPEGLLSLLDSPLTAMHSILCCKLVLHVREVSEYDTDENDDDDGELLPTFIITEVIEPYRLTKVPRYYV